MFKKDRQKLILINQIKFLNYCKYLILKAKEEYTQKMNLILNDPLTGPKMYWSIVDRVKVLLIPHLLVNEE